MIVLALDPGPEVTAWVLYDGEAVLDGAIEPNRDVLALLSWERPALYGVVPVPTYRVRLAIEMIASYGMPVGREVFETCVWIGRFIQAWRWPERVHLVYRADVKLELCGTKRAKDPHVRQALLDRVGKPGTKREPGPTHGVKSHMWAALGVAVVSAENTGELAC